MKRRFRTEISLTDEQKIRFYKTRGVCRFVYNQFIAYNTNRHKNNESYVSAYSFSAYFNNIYLKENPDKLWVKEVSSKSVKKSIMDAHSAFIRFFNGTSRFPKFKKRGVDEPKVYFVRNSPTDCLCERHRIKIPKFGWVRLKEYGYIPTSKNGYTISSGTLDCVGGRFYVSVLVELPDITKSNNTNDGIGIDLGIKDLAILSNGYTYKNINKTARIKKLEKKLKREQRKFSRKYEYKKKGGATQSKNIYKQIVVIQRVHRKLADIRDNYIKTTVSEIVKTKPSYITIEDLNVSGMMKNRHLAKAVQQQKFYQFRQILTQKCVENGIELRIVDRWFPSSKTCNCCGKMKKDLKLSDRIFICDCGYVADRDYNASLNLRDAKTYKLA